jgi:hypothetical protein
MNQFTAVENAIETSAEMTTVNVLSEDTAARNRDTIVT